MPSIVRGTVRSPSRVRARLGNGVALPAEFLQYTPGYFVARCYLRVREW